jgi:predicted acylesterase/phospholipase RssA
MGVMKRKLAFVLGGGGARGAFQVGALKALLEAGFYPDILVGTSVGAANAAFIAFNGFTHPGLDKLTETWREALKADLLPSNYLWLTVRALFNRANDFPVHRMRSFFIDHGLNPDMMFKDIPDFQLLLVAADLNHCQPYIYGFDTDEPVLEGLLASTTLPPWVSPLNKVDRLLIDGGAVSPLAVETAIKAGANEIVALDINDTRDLIVENVPFGPFMGKLANTIQNRLIELELALAHEKGIPVLHIPLTRKEPVPIWNFNYTEELIQSGYETAWLEISRYREREMYKKPGWLRRFISRGAGRRGGSGSRKSPG